MSFSQSRLEEVTDEKLDFIACPECGYDDSDTSRGIAMHFAYNHEGSIKYLFRCDECGRLKFGHGQTNRLCSKYCEIHERVGTLKHHIEPILRGKIEEKGLSIIELSEDWGVPSKTLRKQVRKNNIGSDVECVKDGCDKLFTSRRGMSQHHEIQHGESVDGTNYICQYCGEENWTYRVNRDDPHYPKYCNDDCFGKSISGEDNPNKSEERKQKISEGMKKAYEEGRKEPGGRTPVENQLTGNILDSGWEKEIDSILHRSKFDYSYNGQGQSGRYSIDDFTHAPDFIIFADIDIVIEVKGQRTIQFQEEKMKHIADSLTQRDDIIYVVVGDSDELNSDHFVRYKNKGELLNILNEITGKGRSVLDY